MKQSVTLREEYRLWVYNRVLRTVFESKERVTAG